MGESLMFDCGKDMLHMLLTTLAFLVAPLHLRQRLRPWYFIRATLAKSKR